MSWIVKAEPGCNGKSCRICEEYLPGFFSKDGGITVQQISENAELAKQFCPQQVISIQEYKGR